MDKNELGWNGIDRMYRANSPVPSNYHADNDTCPNCGEFVDIDKDMDEQDYCNLCRWQRRVVPDPVPRDWDKSKFVFVFGSNLAGHHGAGAAKVAMMEWGAQYGVGSGFSGRSYAIPTKDREIKVMSIHSIKPFVDEFIFAAERTQETFLVTKIGCGLAGYTVEQIAPLFKGAVNLDNVWLPEEFWNILNEMTGVDEMELPLVSDELALKLYAFGMYYDTYEHDGERPSVALAERWTEQAFQVNIHDWYNIDDGKWGCSVYRMVLNPREVSEAMYAPGLINHPDELRGYNTKDEAIAAAIEYTLDYYDIDKAVKQIIDRMPLDVAEYKAGNTALLGKFVGELVKFRVGVDPRTAIRVTKNNLESM